MKSKDPQQVKTATHLSQGMMGELDPQPISHLKSSIQTSVLE